MEYRTVVAFVQIYFGKASQLPLRLFGKSGIRNKNRDVGVQNVGNLCQLSFKLSSNIPSYRCVSHVSGELSWALKIEKKKGSSPSFIFKLRSNLTSITYTSFDALAYNTCGYFASSIFA